MIYEKLEKMREMFVALQDLACDLGSLETPEEVEYRKLDEEHLEEYFTLLQLKKELPRFLKDYEDRINEPDWKKYVFPKIGDKPCSGGQPQ